MEEIKREYSARHLKYSAERDQLEKKIRKYSMARILFFLLWLVAVYVASAFTWPVFGTATILGAGIFAILIRRHSLYHRRKVVLDQLVRINREEEEAMDWNYYALDDGKEYRKEDHLFAHDLDIFGRGSLFQYINRTSTISGKNRLAGLLSYVEKDKEEIDMRQQAIAELGPMLGWRQDFRVIGLQAGENPEDVESLNSWVGSPPDFRHFVFRALVVIVPLSNLAVFVLSALNVISFWHFMVYLTIPLIISGIKFRKVSMKHSLLNRKYPLLKKYAALFRMIENMEVTSPRLKENKTVLSSGNITASMAIHKLAKISNAFDTRLNLLAGFLMNVFFLWDIRQSLRLERWQKKYRDHLFHWFRVMGEVDASISLAGFHYNNPGFIFPEILQSEELHLTTRGLGHPLIHARKRVCNDYEVPGWSHFTILTGANMAGKSTFLRTVGVNMLLASCGAPVCATEMKYTPVDIVSSIHTIDSLANNESYFYAELKRLQLIINMLKDGKKVFIILDEILKGTNSGDKQSGSRALVRQLVRLRAAGIIATHDLSLGTLVESFPENIVNKCFEVNIEKDRLDYDYLIKNGIARNMNATILMERMGITVSS